MWNSRQPHDIKTIMHPFRKSSEELEKIAAFLASLGFICRHVDSVPQDSFIKGVYLDGTRLDIAVDQLKFPGDLLHEAGHLAVTPSQFRYCIKGDAESIRPMTSHYMDTHHFIDENRNEDPVMRALLQCGETEAIAWSYAAAVAIGIAPESVFHEGSYNNEGESIIYCLANGGQYLGVHGLQAAKMTTRKGYPVMIRWVQI